MANSVSREWAESLIGLRLQVEGSWWDGWDDDGLWPGTIVDLDFDDPASRMFIFQCDGDSERYNMRYDAVLHYADESHSNFYKYHLPEAPLPSADDEEITLAQLSREKEQRNVQLNYEPTTPDFSNNDTFDLPSDIEEEDADIEEDSDVDTADDSDTNRQSTNFITFRMTQKDEWQKVNATNARQLAPVPFEGNNELFTPKITADELDSLKDHGGDIRFESVFEWMLPRFTIGNSSQTYFQFVAARMRNYMLHIIRTKDYKPKYYDPTKERVIETHHVARFFGVHLARMIRGFPSINDTWSTREPLKHVSTAVESMPKNAYIDMYRCMHFSDDWEESQDGNGETYWEDLYQDAKFGSSPDVEHHRRKYEHIEDGFNARWKEVVNYGRWITADESRVAGWYRSAITIGPEPKPIRTGATIHSICITHGPLATMKLHCRVYGGKHDEKLNRLHRNTETMQKWVNLYDTMLAAFKGKGMCCTLDSA